MKKKALIGGVALMLLAGSAGAAEKPQYFSALQGIQSEPLSSFEMEKTKGSVNWKLLGELAKMWSGLGYAMALTASGDYPGAVNATLTAIVEPLANAYLDYRDADISEKQAKSQLKNAMNRYDQLRKNNPRLPKIKV